MVINPFRERQALRWQEAERRRMAEQSRTSWISEIGTLWRVTVTTTVSLTTTMAVIIVALLAISSGLKQTISVDPLSVPKSMADAGLTPDVTALLLRDSINNMAETVNATERPREVIEKSDIPDIVVPVVGISVQTLATQLFTFLGLKEKQGITGEFTTEGSLIFLNLRLNGARFFSSQKGVSQERISDLLADAAHASLRMTQPYIFAVLMYQNDDKKSALSTAESIIASSSSGNRKLLEAHDLKGAVLDDLGRREEAIAEYKTAIALDPKSVYPHIGLGKVRDDLGRREEAIAEYKTAIALDPKSAYPHDNLGYVLDALGRRDEAIAEYKTAIALDPKYAHPHDNLALLWQFSRFHRCCLRFAFPI